MLPKLIASETALLVIDMQNGFCHEDSEMGKNVGVEHQQAIIGSLIKLVDQMRDLQIPIFWSQQIHFKNDLTRLNKKTTTHFKKQKFLPCLEGTFETDFYTKVKEIMIPNDQVITKHRASLFFDTNLNTRLRMMGIKNLIITGCNTEFCVAHTVRDAYARDYEIFVVEDCVAGIKEKYHKLCLELFSDYFAIVLKSRDLKELFI